MANVLNNEKKQQILALGQLGWSLRRIQAATHVRRETISTYLKAAGVGVWPPGGWGRQTGSKPAMGVTTDFGAELSTARPEIQGLIPGQSAKPAIEVTTGFGVELRGPRSENPGCNPSASACEPFQEAIDLGLSRGRRSRARVIVNACFPTVLAHRGVKSARFEDPFVECKSADPEWILEALSWASTVPIYRHPKTVKHHDVTWTAVSRAPLAEIEAYKKRMGWRFPWASAFGTDFNYDYHVSFGMRPPSVSGSNMRRKHHFHNCSWTERFEHSKQPACDRNGLKSSG